MIDFEYFFYGPFNNYFILFYILGSLVILYILRRSRILDFIIALFLGEVVSEGLKYVSNSPRPLPLRPDLIFEGGGFPSTHTTMAFTVFFFLLFCIKLPKSRKVILTVITLVISIVIGYLRILSHAHFVIDVLAGIIIGFLSAVIFLFYDISGRRVK